MRPAPTTVLRAVFVLALLPLAAGRRIVTYQDALMTHLPAKAATVDQLRSGRVPFVNPYASCGQPLLGNPNFGTFFPDTVLFVALPLFTAFGLHFVLAAVLAFAGARRWARAEGASRPAAEVAGYAFALSGVFVSAWRFYNVGMALAVATWVMAAAAKLIARCAAGSSGRRRAAAELAVWAALEMLAGEPVVALLTFVLSIARIAWSLPVLGLRRAAGLPAVAFGLAALLAAPQLATTLQMFEGSRRGHTPYGFAVATYNSMHPVRLLEQAVAFPFGRPDLRGPDGFTGHRFFDNHSPYLWTLHLGWPTLVLLYGFARFPRGQRFWACAAAVAFVLSLGQFLPGAKKLYLLLSLDGRLRFPIKWWYVIALCLVPVVAAAVDRWRAGEVPRRGMLNLTVVLVIVAAAVAREPAALIGVAVSVLACASLLQAPRRDVVAACAIAGALAAAEWPLVHALVDRPPLTAPPRLSGRVYERLAVDAHPPEGTAGGGERTVPEFFRRARPELWAITGGLDGIGYAFDFDPDGSYSDPDRVVRKQLDDLSWPERAPILRAAGVAHVVSGESLPAPYRLVADLNPSAGARLYALEGPAPLLRFASGGGVVTALAESPSRLRAQVDSPQAATLVWSRSYFPAWRATIDGVPERPFPAERHLVGLAVPSGAHEVIVEWSTRPLAIGLGLLACGIVGVVLFYRGT